MISSGVMGRYVVLDIDAVKLLVALELLELHGPNGQRAYLNAHQISSLREPTDRDLARSFAKGVRCVVVTTNGKFLAVVEPCDAIRDMVAGPATR